MQINVFDNETIYDIAIRLYGSIDAIEVLISQLDTYDLPSTIDQVDYLPPVFIAPEEVEEETEILVIKGLENQSIFDVAIQSGGDVNTLSNVISQFSSINESAIHKTFNVVRANDVVLDTIINRNLLYATKGIDVEVLTNWILANGVWDDTGIWIDTETWNDN